MQLPSFVPNALGWLAFHITKMQPFIPTYIHLIVSAIFPIYAGAHAALSRPSSAAKPVKSTKRGYSDPEEEEDEPLRMEGLSPTDAIMFPILAGSTLAGLYFLIKWLQDPAILNKILNWYFATFSVFSVSRMVSDALDVLHSYIFPHDYVDGGVLFHIDAQKKQAIPVGASVTEARGTPLPSFLSRLPLPRFLTSLFWILHVVPNRKLTFKASLGPLGEFKARLGVHGIEGLTIGLASVLYYNLVAKPWWLTNLMGFGFAYGSLQILSPTTFWTGTLVLSALFFYDIYFVFYTPMMVTVAKSLDIPIKLLFPRPAEPGADPASRPMSMLGLGDVVLPGIMIGLALRFDLFMLYLKKQTKKGSGSSSIKKSTSTVGNESQTPDEKPVSEHIIKVHYQPVAEGWGDRLWTSRLFSSRTMKYVPRGVFPKPYFHASLFGYLAGMVATLSAMQIMEHAQPALLYLVPGVLSSMWLTGWARGEIKEMWNFSDMTEDEEDAEKRKKEEEEKAKDEAAHPKTFWEKCEEYFGFTSFFSSARSERREKNLDKFLSKHVKDGSGGEQKGEEEGKDDADNSASVSSKKKTSKGFSISIELPVLFPERRKSADEDEAQTAGGSAAASGVAPRWNVAGDGDNGGDEHIGKRQRLG